MKLLIAAIVSLVLLTATAAAQNVSMDISGTCLDYDVTVYMEDFAPECYDVKIDVTNTAGRVGEIFDPREGWKSTMYYVDEDFCVSGGQLQGTTYKVRVDTNEKDLSFKASVRHRNKVVSSEYYDFEQDCLVIQESNYFWLIVVVVALVLVLALVMTVHVKRDKPKKGNEKEE